jgi:hypothetical protein
MSNANRNFLLQGVFKKTHREESAHAARKTDGWQNLQQVVLMYSSEEQKIAHTREKVELEKAQALGQREKTQAEKKKKA